jgi:dynein light intermediate chain
MLNSILPPLVFKNDAGDDLIQYVSTTPVVRSDIVKLRHLLDSTLQQRKAGENGLFPIHSELYSQCFDEIIRQVTTDCSARGLLPVRVRDEMLMMISAYYGPYESTITWEMRKVMVR